MTDLQSILNDLQQPDPAVRLPAIYALTESGNPLAVDALRRLLWDDSKVATHAATIRALGQLGGDRALEPLIRALKHDHATVRDTAAQALGDMGDPRAVDPLIEVLQTGRGMLRATAAESLGKLGDGRAVEALIRALDDERADVRFAAAGALGQLGDARAVNPLIAALDDPAVIYGGAVCEAAAEALERVGTPEAQAAVEKWRAVWDVIAGASVESLIESLHHDLWEVRHSAAYMLGEMKDARAVDPLIAALDEPVLPPDPDQAIPASLSGWKLSRGRLWAPCRCGGPDKPVRAGRFAVSVELEIERLEKQERVWLLRWAAATWTSTREKTWVSGSPKYPRERRKGT